MANRRFYVKAVGAKMGQEYYAGEEELARTKYLKDLELPEDTQLEVEELNVKTGKPLTAKQEAKKDKKDSKAKKTKEKKVAKTKKDKKTTQPPKALEVLPKDKQNDKTLYTKEVAAMCGVTPKALRRVLRAKWYADGKTTHYAWNPTDKVLGEILAHYGKKLPAKKAKTQATA